MALLLFSYKCLCTVAFGIRAEGRWCGQWEVTSNLQDHITSPMTRSPPDHVTHPMIHLMSHLLPPSPHEQSDWHTRAVINQDVQPSTLYRDLTFDLRCVPLVSTLWMCNEPQQARDFELSSNSGYDFGWLHKWRLNQILFRWFKFTLKPPNSITSGKLRLAI